jgi:hypothetical protein
MFVFFPDRFLDVRFPGVVIAIFQLIFLPLFNIKKLTMTVSKDCSGAVNSFIHNAFPV